jgi:glutamate dehydrogenase
MAVGSASNLTRQRVIRELKTFDSNRDPLFVAFVTEAVGRLRGPFLAQHPPKHILKFLDEAFRFSVERRADDIKVRIHEGSSKGVAIFSTMTDQPFIVDTIRLFLKKNEAEYWGGFNVVLRVNRDAEGRLTAVGEDQPLAESFVMLEAETGLLGHDSETAGNNLRHQLELARALSRDFRAMTRTIERWTEKLETQAERLPDQANAFREASEFTKWLLRENFVFMGVEGDAKLGIQTLETPYGGTRDGAWPPPHEPAMIRVRKSNIESPVHRAGKIDEILIELDPSDPTAPSLFVRGMFTYRAVTQPSRNVPILRRVLANILASQESLPGSYRYKGIANVFDSLPSEFLFTASEQSIGEMVDLVFESEQQQEVGVTLLETGSDSAFCLVSMPKGQYSDELRRDLEAEIVGSLRASYKDHGLFVGRFETVLLHYYVTGIQFPKGEAYDKLVDRIRLIATPWSSRLWDALAASHDEPTADRLVDTYGRAFPESYIRHTTPERAVEDINRLEALSGRRKVIADLFSTDAGEIQLRMYEAHEVSLTDTLPVLDHFGLTVIRADNATVNSRGGRLHIDTFTLGVFGDADQFLARTQLLVDALGAVFAKEVDDDRLNRLVLTAGLSWRQVDVLRAYVHYLHQLEFSLPPLRLRELLLDNPTACARLIALFAAKFDPTVAADARPAAMSAAADAVDDAIRALATHDEDIAFRAFNELVHASIRTNAFREDRKPYYVSIKFDCSKIKFMKGERPMFEIFVHCPVLDGVHLRFAKVARGGLRWSDRGDYRTEVLGLVTTQQVKNVVIVPEGSKGGFFLRDASKDPAIRRRQADEYYKIFIRALLDVTDNVVDGKPVSPPNVVCHDPFDPYLVVAADKGTAHLSDTANAVSMQYGFWLGDAFASGGSNGYDHKKVGITARGGWVLVKRHFAEIGVDPYTQPFTCVGVGDMGGDVFGNGLIETAQTKLRAAFNHAHIFLDPNPDPASSHAERLRLFQMGPSGGWGQYDTTKISKGGGVFDRRVKAIPITPEVQEMLGLQQETANPEEVIRHILRMEVDLLWSGGIGTYVKASSESNTDAGDRTNDDARVDADELRCRIAGEGANLSFTRKARIEAALRGVRLNTDAIDNSAGVDLSDHEVNLKILLRGPVSRGELSEEARNTLLAEMTDEVALLVLSDNDAQGKQISLDQIRSQVDLFPFARAIAFIERQFNRSRTTLDLPSDEELARRAEAKLGLTRPELATLQAWLKMWANRELLHKADPKAFSRYSDYLVNYFPKDIQARYPRDIASHQLGSEIAMTVAITRIFSDAGCAFLPLAVERTGASVARIAEAYLRAQELAGVEGFRPKLEELRTHASLGGLYRAWLTLDGYVRDVALAWAASPDPIPSADALSAFRDAVRAVYQLQPPHHVGRHREQVQRLGQLDLPEAFATELIGTQYLAVGVQVAAFAASSGRPIPETAIRLLAVGGASRLQEIVSGLQRRAATGKWDPVAFSILHRRFSTILGQLVTRTAAAASADAVDKLEANLSKGALKDIRARVEECLDGTEPSVSTLLVLEERLDAAIAQL